MMKKRNKMALMLPLMASLCVGNVHAKGNHDGFIAGACAIGAALIGTAGVVAFADWCCSETDDQLIARVNREYRSIDLQYTGTMSYFSNLAHVRPLSKNIYQIRDIQESALYEFATHVWNKNISQSDYRSGVWSAKHTLQSGVQDLRKRIHSLENKNKYENQRILSIMRNLLSSTESLLLEITLFAECLEFHQGYFTLYDSVGTIRNKYIQEVTILEYGHYTAASEIKRYILSCDSGQYAFKNFVKNIERNISTLQSNVNALGSDSVNYDNCGHMMDYLLVDNAAGRYKAGRKYANHLINQLTDIKQVVVTDPRYQQELYQWEQARLERQRMDAFEAQARLERDRMRILQQQNRILEEQNRIARQNMYAQCVNYPEVRVDVTFEL